MLPPNDSTNYPEIEIVLPVYNEKELLEKNTLQVKNFLEEHRLRFIISIVDNGSTDNSFEIAQKLEQKFSNICAFRLEEKGRGGALRYRITHSNCSLIGYMDADLSADLSDFLKMYNELKKGHDIIIGSRLCPTSVVQRSLMRAFLSKAYSKAVRSILKLPFFDYQCGCKLVKREMIVKLMPLVRNNNWFFDTELIFYAHQEGLRIKEFPLTWRESERKSKVNLIGYICENIKGIMHLKKVQKS